MNIYPPPESNPQCQCWPNMLAAMFCTYGHMLECHYPQTCSEAECSHLARYRDPLDDTDINSPLPRGRGAGGEGQP